MIKYKLEDYTKSDIPIIQMELLTSIANELAEMNRLKRMELQLQYGAGTTDEAK